MASIVYDNQVYNEFYRDIAQDRLSGIVSFNSFGYNDDFGTTRESLIPEGGIYYWLPSAQQVQISSESSNDTLTGTGAQKAHIQGLDGNFEGIDETVDLNGTATVTTTQSFRRILDFRIVQGGSLEENDGKIILQDNAQNNTVEKILAGEGMAHSATWSVAKNRTTYAVHWYGAEISNKGVKAELWIRDIDGQIWRKGREAYVHGTYFNNFLRFPIPVPGNIDVEMRVVGLQSGSGATGGFSGY